MDWLNRSVKMKHLAVLVLAISSVIWYQEYKIDRIPNEIGEAASILEETSENNSQQILQISSLLDRINETLDRMQTLDVSLNAEGGSASVLLISDDILRRVLIQREQQLIEESFNGRLSTDSGTDHYMHSRDRSP